MATQQNIVYFLGAGCSYNFGYPLTKDIMPAILQRLQAGNLFLSDYDGRSKADADLEQRLLGYIQLVYPGLGNGSSGPEVPNITEIFSFVDHLCFYDTPHHPSLGGDRLLDCRALLNRALGELLQWYEYNHKPTYEQKVLHRQFIASIRQEIKNGHSVTVITTNYDLTVDNFFVQEAQHNKIDFGIPYRDVDDSRLIIQPTEPVLRYYKLHGSLNWLMCSLCGQYYINPIGSIVHQAYRQEVDDNNTCECNKKMPLKPVLVPPSLVRDVRDPNLLQVWKGALESIRHADRLIMIGYSMPAEDLAIKSVILRGINGRNKDAPALEVVQYGDAAKPNYRNIFGGIFRESQYYPTGLAPYLMENHPALFTV